MISVALVLVFFILPASFAFGGGMYGGSPIWFAFTAIYIVMGLEKKIRAFLLACEAAILGGCWYVGYMYPELIMKRSAQSAYIGSLMSLFLASVFITLLISYRNNVFDAENKRLREKIKEMDAGTNEQNHFFSSMSRRIRTPINTILGLNELMLQDDDITEDVARDAANIQGAGRMLLALVNDILDLSRIESGDMNIVPVNYSTKGMITEIVNMIRTGAENKRLELWVDVAIDLPSVLYGDVVRIKQIMVNILNNAVKYTAEGSVSLRMTYEKRRDNEINLIISVRDTGMGIKEDALPHLFDAFSRVDLERNRNIEGTGLGLSVVKQLVELMGGQITVSSVYTKGSVFTVELPQRVSDPRGVGAVFESGTDNIGYKKDKTVLFYAPGAKVLLVDDDEQNTLVETKLIQDTGVIIDTVPNGVKALEATLSTVYDVILMDHMMPGIDGIDCLERIRRQVGGLNKNTPVIMVTANAGTDSVNRYNAAGFDGCLIKPVAMNDLQTMLLRYISADKIVRSEGDAGEKDNEDNSYMRKAPVIITASTMSDIPEKIVRDLSIPIVPFTVHTDRGVFRDCTDIEYGELLKYMKDDDRILYTDCPTVDVLEAFFESALKKAHSVIHITVTSKVSAERDRALEAAQRTGNVTVVDSEFMSSAYGLMVLIASRMAKQNETAENILMEIEEIKKRMHCNFILKDTDYMARRSLVNPHIGRLLKRLNIHVTLGVKDGKFGMDRLYVGSLRKCYLDYIKHELERREAPDTDIIFVTYVGMEEEDLMWIEQEIKKRYDFNRIIFSRASASISANAGPGTFGLLYLDEGGREYHVSSMMPEELSEIYKETPVKGEESKASEAVEEEAGLAIEDEKSHNNNVTDKNWYNRIPGVDGKLGIRFSGTEKAYHELLQVFYEALPGKAAEIEGYYENEDWRNYTIKVHALKSSSKLIGAKKLSEDAQLMENAGKADDIEYIRAHHREIMDQYNGLLEPLRELFGNDEPDDNAPLADPGIIQGVFEGVYEAAGRMDSDAIEEIFEEMSGYRIPDSDKALYDKVKEASDNFNYEAIVALLVDRFV